MCTEKCLELAQGSRVTRRAAMVGAAAVAASAALAGTSEAGSGGRRLGPGGTGCVT